MSDVRGGDGVFRERPGFLQTETSSRSVSSGGRGRAHSGAGAAGRPLQEADAHVQAERLRFRGRLGTLSDFILGSDRGVACGTAAAVHLVPPVWRRRLPNPEGERSAVSLLQKPRWPATGSREVGLFGGSIEWKV